MRLKQFRIFLWVINFYRWIAEGKTILMGLLVLGVIVLFSFVVCKSEPSIRIGGFALQFIGMVFTIRALLAIRAHFGQPLLRQLFLRWLKRFPKWRGKNTVGAGTAMSSESTMDFRAEVWETDNPEWPLEKRVEALLKNVGRIRQEQSQQHFAVQELKASHEQHKKLVEEKSKKLEESIQADLEVLHTGDMLISFVGLTWIIVGLALSTLSPELAKWLYGA